jgi:zinc protease
MHAGLEASYECNAEVSGRFTTFYMHSTDPADIARFVAGVCAGLTRDGSAELEQEKLILRTEAASRGTAGVLATCLTERYGARGPGVLAYDELGLHRLGWAEIEQWRSRWFVAANAVLWMAGTVPDGLHLPLPGGHPPAPAPLVPLSIPLPGFLVTGQGGVGISLVGERSFASPVALDIIQRRLTQALRHERGLSYSVHAAGDQLSADVTHAWLAADALPEQVPAAAHTALTTLEGLAATGCQPGEIGEHARRTKESYESPNASIGVLQQQARNILDGRPVQAPEEILRLTAAVTPQEVGAATAAMLSQAMVVTPQRVPAVQGRMPELPRWSADSIDGQRLASNRSTTVLTIGSQGIMLSGDGEQRVTVRYANVAALLRWNDGKRAVVGTDGFTLRLDPAEWANGEAALATINAQVDPAVAVDIATPAPWTAPEAAPPAPRAKPQTPSAPQGSAPAAPPGRTQPGLTQPTGASRNKLTSPAAWVSGILWALILLCWLFGLLAWLGGDKQAWTALVIAAAAALWRLGPRAYRVVQPKAPPSPWHGWGFRITRVILVSATVMGLMTWSTDVAAGPAVTLTSAVALVAQDVIARFLNRASASNRTG